MINFLNQGYNYLVHHTTKENWENIKKHKYIYSEYDRYINKIESKGVYSITSFNFNKPWENSPGQFPGIYCSLINNVNDLYKQFNMTDESLLLFLRLELLNQKNWHFNLFDRCGTFGYDTFTYENIINIPDYNIVSKFYIENIGKYYNEVIFHDSISFSNVDFIYDGNKIHERKSSINLCSKYGGFLYYSDLYYTGMDVPYFSYPDKISTDDIFYKKYCQKYLGKYCNILKDCNTKLEIEDKIASVNPNCCKFINKQKNLFTYLFLNRLN